VVSHTFANDKNYAFDLLKKRGFNFLADAAYDSTNLYDHVQLKAGSIAFFFFPPLFSLKFVGFLTIFLLTPFIQNSHSSLVHSPQFASG